MNQRLKRWQQAWLRFNRPLAPGTTAPHAPPKLIVTTAQFRQAAADRAAGNAGRLMHRQDPAQVCGLGRGGSEPTPPALVQDGRQHVETGLDGVYVDHDARVAAPGLEPCRLPDSILAFSTPSGFYSGDSVIGARVLRIRAPITDPNRRPLSVSDTPCQDDVDRHIEAVIQARILSVVDTAAGTRTS